MTSIHRAGSILALGATLACASDNLLLPPQGLKFAVAHGQCGPADGAALTIFLTRDPPNGPSPSAPYVRVYISDASQADGRSLAVTGHNAGADAMYTRIDNASGSTSEVAESVIASSSGCDTQPAAVNEAPAP